MRVLWLANCCAVNGVAERGFGQLYKSLRETWSLRRADEASKGALGKIFDGQQCLDARIKSAHDGRIIQNTGALRELSKSAR
jgi:hypothetical protein